MSYVILIVVSLLIAAGGVGGMILLLKNGDGGSAKISALIEAEVSKRLELKERFQKSFAELVPIPKFRESYADIKVTQEALRAERGRITITQAELETVENRLRELEEIERELEASGLETKEELTILQKKQADLASKNEALQAQIKASTEQMDQLFKEIEMSAEAQAAVQAAKTELLSTEQQVEVLALQVQEGNDQYFILKKRYDALDIEYAQLYEKFSEAEAMMGNAKSGEKS